MNTKDNQQKSKEEEVDLGKLFQVIGKGFSNLFNFIGGIFKSLFQFLIVVLLFIKRHFIILFLSFVIGIVLGYFSEGGKKAYTSSMVVKPNFKSVRQLYNNVAYFNDLASQEDSLALSNIFNISLKEAKSLSDFTIEPLVSFSIDLNDYNDFVRSSDTTTVKQIEFKDFIKNRTKFDYKYHKITVKSDDKKLFSKLKAGLINTFNYNDYLVSLKNTQATNIEIQEKLTNKNLAQADSLRQIYSKSMLLEANKPFSGTNIDMAQGKEKTNKELELFIIQNNYKKDLVAINNDKTENQNIINVVSDFNKVGAKISIIYRKPGNYAFMLFGLTFLGLLLIELNKYLNTIKNKSK